MPHLHVQTLHITRRTAAHHDHTTLEHMPIILLAATQTTTRLPVILSAVTQPHPRSPTNSNTGSSITGMSRYVYKGVKGNACTAHNLIREPNELTALPLTLGTRFNQTGQMHWEQPLEQPLITIPATSR